MNPTKKKVGTSKVDPKYNKMFMLAWLNLELILQEKQFSSTRSLIEEAA